MDPHTVLLLETSQWLSARSSNNIAHLGAAVGVDLGLTIVLALFGCARNREPRITCANQPKTESVPEDEPSASKRAATTLRNGGGETL